MNHRELIAWRASAVGLASGALGMAAGMTGLGVHFARKVLTPAPRPDARVTVCAVEGSSDGEAAPERVWIQGPDAALEGKYSFIFDGGTGHARVGPVVDRIVDREGVRVAREVVAVDRGVLRPGTRGRITGWWYTDPNELGYHSRSEEIPLAGGRGRAWVVAPDTPVAGRWAVHVHGRGALPQETLRGVRPFARAGVTSLVISYRNDPGAPRGVRGRYGLGLAERLDVDAAIGWALGQGAERVTLAGWSMGGTASVLSATRGRFRNAVDGLLLDSPALDWPLLLQQQARLARAPRLTADIALRLLQAGWVRGAVPDQRGTDLSALTAESLAAGLRVPVLIHASAGDTFVPWDGSLRFARLRPDLVRLRVGNGEHVKLWNTDPTGWEDPTEAFVRGLGDPPGSQQRGCESDRTA